jgi:hypothetical protein
LGRFGRFARNPRFFGSASQLFRSVPPFGHHISGFHVARGLSDDDDEVDSRRKEIGGHSKRLAHQSFGAIARDCSTNLSRRRNPEPSRHPVSTSRHHEHESARRYPHATLLNAIELGAFANARRSAHFW